MGHTVTTKRAKPPFALKVAEMWRATRRAHHQWKGDKGKQAPPDAWDRATEETEQPDVWEASSSSTSLTRSLLRFPHLSLGSEAWPVVEENQVKDCVLVLGWGPALGLHRQLPMESCKNCLTEGIKTRLGTQERFGRADWLGAKIHTREASSALFSILRWSIHFDESIPCEKQMKTNYSISLWLNL